MTNSFFDHGSRILKEIAFRLKIAQYRLETKSSIIIFDSTNLKIMFTPDNIIYIKNNNNMKYLEYQDLLDLDWCVHKIQK